MTTTVTLPAITEVVQMMNDLFDLETKEAQLPASEIFSIAEFVDEAGEIVGFMACDLATGCRMGCALTQIPAGRVDEAVKDAELPESIAENLSEIFNINVNLIAASAGSRVVLGRVAHASDAALFAELNEQLQSRTKTDFGFEIARYGACNLSIIV